MSPPSEDSDRHLKKMKPKSPPSRSSSDTSADWRMVGKSSRDRVPSSMKKKVEQSSSTTTRFSTGAGSMTAAGSGSSSGSSSETSHLTMTMTSTDQRNPNSHSTRREMRGLMKAIDSASNSEMNRERKDVRFATATEKTDSSATLKSPPKKSLPAHKLETSSRSSSASSPPRLSKKSDVTESLSRNRGIVNTSATSEDTNGSTEHQQIQSRQASAENSFIQRVRRSPPIPSVLLSLLLFPHDLF
jgi:hypothetical protein